eukprot:3369263-Karenia_brevis.AAC.1
MYMTFGGGAAAASSEGVEHDGGGVAALPKGRKAKTATASKKKSAQPYKPVFRVRGKQPPRR